MTQVDKDYRQSISDPIQMKKIFLMIIPQKNYINLVNKKLLQEITYCKNQAKNYSK